MNKELGEKLYDEKYPLTPASMEDGKDSKRGNQIFYYGKDSIGRDGSWLYPTLSELINECNKIGDKRMARLEYVRYYGEHKWSAFANDFDQDAGHYGHGKSPEEAVANLWLKLSPQPYHF